MNWRNYIATVRNKLPLSHDRCKNSINSVIWSRCNNYRTSVTRSCCKIREPLSHDLAVAILESLPYDLVVTILYAKIRSNNVNYFCYNEMMWQSFSNCNNDVMWQRLSNCYSEIMWQRFSNCYSEIISIETGNIGYTMPVNDFSSGPVAHGQ
jgi:hypothetical protein